MSGLPENTDSTKSKICVVGSILTVILGLSFAFIWSGSIMYGLVLLGLPILSIILITYFYVHQEPEEDYNAYFPAGLIDVTENMNSTRLEDRPPSYRMTWRRSFIKKFRRSTAGGTSPTIANETAVEINQFTDETIQNESDPSNKVLQSVNNTVSITMDTSNLSNTELELSNEESSIEPSSIEASNGPNIDSDNASVNKSVLNIQYSLPTYEEAVIIMKSTENLS